MKRGRTIRGRIVRMLALPVAAMMLLLSVVVVEEFTTYRLAARTGHAITLDLAVQALAQEVQNERGVTLGLLAGNQDFAGQITPARQQVDTRRGGVEQLVAERGDLDGQVTEALEQTVVLAEIRDEVDKGGADRNEIFDDYNEVVEELGEVYFALDNAADATMRLGSESLAMLNLAKEARAQQRAFLNGVFSAGGFTDGEFLRYVQLRADLNAAVAEFEEYATPEAIAAKDQLFSSDPADRALQLETRALRSGDGQPLRADTQLWWTSTGTVLDDMTRLAQQIGASLQARADVLLDQANLRLAGLAAVVLLCVGIAIYLGTVAAHSIASPLAGLAAEANRVAGERLPEAVRRAITGEATGPPGAVRVAERASTEVRLVADAFDRVQATAYALATEQADLRRAGAESLANLGRRNQNLLRRQLGFITRLEQEESSPAGLANLFELDHLATRMRRNAESLLVLVGAASPRQWSRPLPLTDVIRAAVSEVEEYRRVSLRRLDEAMVTGSVVSGLAHMLAELIENGLAFSPPDLDVEIHGRLIDGGYLIAVCDQGVGMSEAELDVANRRLRGEGDFITAPARFLGHYVVGRLAAEMGVGVQLARSPVTGVTARVSLPAGILATAEAITAPSSPAAPPVASLPAPAAPSSAAAPSSPAASSPDTPSPAASADDDTTPLNGTAVLMAPEPVGLPSLARSAVGPRPLAEEVDYVVLDHRPQVPAPRRPLSAPMHGDAGHTVNGLRRRTPRAQRTREETAPPPRPTPAVPVTDTPEAVRDRLTALRAGIQRGSGRPRHIVNEEIS
ncbi:nitrate- and nitrite sensing domain-containing protein [Actinoplanes sp. NEAU-A12]|uniref:histidine kinase n=1 Tax=Actinoplanes sandaracinus TaxID=3045177 RepID=A0ABT6WPN8_9ACTN|nr:nitrate- and nitrite sensing domain-containing protein [Actinoplanes sandaracinus]MDI6101715.1 nitrate- and nitrite sensing domain-containing protein [Actinoplanes sandaracinus]